MKRIKKNEVMVFIYELIDPITFETRYIGKTKQLNKRLNGHLWRAKNKLSFVYKENWIRSLLNRNLKPIINIIDEVDKNEANFWEIFYISLYRSWNCKLTNTTKGGDGGNGNKQSEETIKKRINTRRNNGKPWVSEEQKVEMRNNNLGENNPNWGVKCSEETKDRISKGTKNKTKIYSKEGLKRKLEFMRLHPPRKGKKCSEETKDSLRKPIMQLNLDGSFVREFKSYTEALEITKIKGIANCLTERAKTAGGFIWKYKATTV
jgi:hypothetical protein